MKRTLKAHVQAWHLLLAVVLLVALNGGSVLAKIGPNAFRPPGSFMVAAQSATALDALYIGSDDTTVLSRAISVPTGKRADLFAFFGADAFCFDNLGTTSGEFRLDSPTGTVFAPGEAVLVDHSVFAQGNPHISFQGYKYSVPAGPHTVYVTMESTDPDQVRVSDRSLIVIANIHD